MQRPNQERQGPSMILQKDFLSRILAALAVASGDAEDGPLVAAKVMLFKNNVVLTPSTVLADLQEPTYDTYARSTVLVTDGPYISQGTGLPTLLGDAKTFAVTANDDEETIYGFALVEDVGTDKLLAAEMFSEPWTPGAGNAVVIVPRIGLNSADSSPDGDVTFI